MKTNEHPYKSPKLILIALRFCLMYKDCKPLMEAAEEKLVELVVELVRRTVIVETT